MRRALFVVWLRTIDALVMCLDRTMSPPVPPNIWVPEARPTNDERWDDDGASRGIR